MSKSWRDHAAPIVAQVLAQTAGQDEKAIKKALFDAYPFGQREMHPYKIWLDEIKRQRGVRRPLTKIQKAKAVEAIARWNEPHLFDEGQEVASDTTPPEWSEG